MIERLRTAARRLPVSISVVVLTILAGWWTTGRAGRHAALMSRFGVGWSDIASLRLYRLATAELIQGRPGIRATVGLLLFVIPVVEWNIGPRLTLTVMLLGDWMSTVPVLAGLRIVGGLGNTHAMTTALMRDGGTSSAVHALAAAATSKMSSRVARRSVIALVGVEIAVSTAIAPRLFDLQHAISAVAGLALGRWLLAAHAT